MRHAFKASMIGLGALGALAVAAPAAWAGCGSPAVQPASYPLPNGAQLIPANLGAQGVVGLWAVQFTVGGNPFDFGYAEWHSDGTEIMNSGSRPPATENFCMGVWRQSGPNTYHLKHYALSYTTAGVMDHRVIITEDVTIDATGNGFSGPASYDIYDPSGVTLQAHVPAAVTGHRILPN